MNLPWNDVFNKSIRQTNFISQLIGWIYGQLEHAISNQIDMKLEFCLNMQCRSGTRITTRNESWLMTSARTLNSTLTRVRVVIRESRSRSGRNWESSPGLGTRSRWGPGLGLGSWVGWWGWKIFFLLYEDKSF